MSNAASLLQGEGPVGSVPLAGGLPSDVLKRHVAQRRHTFAVQVVSYALGTAALLIYVHAGTIAPLIPSAFFLSGVALIGVFALLSEMQVNDRFDDHYLTVFQVAGHVVIQLGFLLVAPEIGYAFLNVLFLIFGVAALRMTPLQAAIAWTLTALAIASIFLLTRVPIGMPVASPVERLAAASCLILTIGQCAFVGLYGDSLRKKLYKRGIELSEAYKRIEELAELDELTGSFNRRCIMRMLDDEIARAYRSKTACSIALIDLDWFKRINDAYGHPTGDEVLRAFAISVFANIRNIDRFGRYGGEEFLLVLPDTPHDGAARILDRLRAIIADLDWSAFSPGMRVTISAGVATLNPNETPDTLLARADSALYAAKARGRNRIASA
ncbi:MAG: GGDEF domain-containing protein [Bradyrhizobium sp.]|uniref:GGDEF domain-containing protein n=1 Tax=Bradyrhizobium sp. TaxID=376 RepID=UPI0012202599|nr:GGDEF domain-containing protein [Bradyrhizobium sp.]THD62824.1 MAG: GGDEF domain-containing protein [Bradyrhizobium sp.]